MIIYEETASTNEDLKRLAREGTPAGTAVLALRQSAGKGSQGRSFCSQEGGLYLSYLLRPVCTPEEALALTPRVAVSVMDFVRACFGAQTEKRGINDVFLNGRKLAGILCESIVVPGHDTADAVIIGVGINITTPAFPEELRDIATSLAIEGYTGERTIPELAEVLVTNLAKLEL